MSQTTTAASRYRQLETARTSVLNRAREAAKLTIPSLMPPDGHSEISTLPTPFQGLGARGVNNLASKLLLALFPPNSPFFRLMVDDFTLQKMTQKQGMRAEVEKALNMIERSVQGEIETTAIRVSAFEALKQLITAGNVLVHLTPKGGMRVFKLNQYVVKRDPAGNVLEFIVKEEVAPDTLPEVIRTRLKNAEGADAQKTAELYTRVYRRGDQWHVLQETQGMIIPGTKGSYPLDKSPWIVLRFTKIDGENYGRGYIEEYLGDLISLESLTKSIVEGAAASARVLFLVNPNGTTTMKTLAEAPNGAIRQGNAADVSVLQVQKFADFRVAQEAIASITQRLSFAFLMNTAVQRGGERVTAEEIRYMAGELEDALGGVYSILSQEFQLPLVNRIIFTMERQKRFPTLPKGMVKPTITTGLEALGRGHDMNKLNLFADIAGKAQALPPEVNKSDFLTRIGTALGIDMAGLMKSPEEMQAEQQQQFMQQLIDKLGPNAMNIIRDQMNPQVQGNVPADPTSQAQGLPEGA